MTSKQYEKILCPPQGVVDVILDTDTYNEVDDQYAVAYMIGKSKKLNIKGICAAPFLKPPRSTTPAEGMVKSYQEILHVLQLLEREDLKDLVYRGSDRFMESETVPVESQAADYMAKLADDYSSDRPLYIVAIGAITNVASALLKNPRMKDRCVVVWLGGNATHIPLGGNEFNMKQDIAAARVVFGCGVPLVHLPCKGVIDRFVTTKQELSYWMAGKNALCDYLYAETVAYVESITKVETWSKVIWDVAAVAWLLNENNCFMQSVMMPSPIPEYDNCYALDADRHRICSINWINRDTLFEDMFRTLTQKRNFEKTRDLL